MPHKNTSRRAALAALASLSALVLLPLGARAQGGDLPAAVPPGARLVVADQNEALQTLMRASGEHGKLTAGVSYANFVGGPAILEAFRAGAVDLAVVGNTPPIQAHAAGEEIPIVAARRNAAPDYFFAVRPGLTVATLQEFKGKKIAYGIGTGRQPYVLTALKLAGLTKRDVTLVPLRASEFDTAVRTGQVDLASLIEPNFSRYLRDFADQKASALPASEHARLPTKLSYLYASKAALNDPAKAAAIREFVGAWIRASYWSVKNPDPWVDAYYVRNRKLQREDGIAIVKSEGDVSFPALADSIAGQQELIDLIHEAGDLPRRLDARQEFDLRFDPVIREAVAAVQAGK